MPPDDERRVAIRNDPELRLYVWGWLKYDDVWGSRHETHYAFVNGFREDGRHWWSCETGNTMTTHAREPEGNDLNPN